MNADMLALGLVMLVDFVLERLEQFVFGACLPKSEQPVRSPGWRHEHTNHAALNHAIEVALPGHKGGRFRHQLLFVQGGLVIGVGWRWQDAAEQGEMQEKTFHTVLPDSDCRSVCATSHRGQ